MSKFVSTERKGFQMTFENGLTASVQWGPTNFCANRSYADPIPVTDQSSEDAEVAVWDTEDNWLDPANFIDCSSDTMVAGHISADRVAAFLYLVSKYPISRRHKNERVEEPNDEQIDV